MRKVTKTVNESREKRKQFLKTCICEQCCRCVGCKVGREAGGYRDAVHLKNIHLFRMCAFAFYCMICKQCKKTCLSKNEVNFQSIFIVFLACTYFTIHITKASSQSGGVELACHVFSVCILFIFSFNCNFKSSLSSKIVLIQ